MNNEKIHFLNIHLSKIYCCGFVILVCLLLSLFGFEKISGVTIKKTELHENRNYATFPVFSDTSLYELPLKIEDYFNDNLPLRNQIIYKYNKYQKSGNDVVIIKGKHNHTFSTIGRNKIFNQITERDKLYNDMIYILGRKSLWEHNNAEYMCILAPPKVYIYSEFYPKSYGNIFNRGKYLKDFFLNNGFDGEWLLDLTSILIENKNKGLLYNTTIDGFHWNGLAIKVVYDYLSGLLKSRKYYTYNENTPEYILNYEKTNTIDKEIPILITNNKNLSIEPLKYQYTYKNYSHKVSDKKDSTNIDVVKNAKAFNSCVAIFSDSFFKNSGQNKVLDTFGYILPLANNFQYYIHGSRDILSQKLYTDIINDYHPNLVLDEFFSGYLGSTTPSYINNYIFVLGEIIYNNQYLFISPHYINAISDASNKEYLFYMDSNNLIQLPAIRSNSTGRACIIAKINSPVDGKVVLYYKQSNIKNKNYDTFEQEVKKGDNYLYMPIYGKPDKEFKLQLSFSKEGEYIFYPQPTIEEICNNYKEE